MKNLPCKDAGSWSCSTIIDTLGELAGVIEISVASPGIANKPWHTKGLMLDEPDPGLLCKPGEPRSGLDKVLVRKEQLGALSMEIASWQESCMRMGIAVGTVKHPLRNHKGCE